MTTRHLSILTGSSRGLGQGLALALLRAGHDLLCIARRPSAALAAQAEALQRPCTQWQLDLAQGAEAAARLRAWLAAQDGTPWASATLVNNAGVVAPLVPLSASRPDDLAQALRVGLEAPMQLSAAFLDATGHWPGRRRVLNISSGLARRAQASQGAYCAAKAGLEHFTRCLALEEAAKPNGARVCALSPGVIDTDMQRQLRSADAAGFPDVDGFVQLHANGQLLSPEAAAARVLAYLARPDFGTQPVADVRDT